MSEFDDKEFEDNRWTTKEILLLTYSLLINIVTIGLILFFVL